MANISSLFVPIFFYSKHLAYTNSASLSIVIAFIPVFVYYEREGETLTQRVGERENIYAEY